MIPDPAPGGINPIAPGIGWVRAVSLTEGVSFLVLLVVAMPLKYLADEPAAVTVVGWVHGVLFIGLAALILRASLSWRLRGAVMIAALLPGGPFVVDRHLRAVQRSAGPLRSAA